MHNLKGICQFIQEAILNIYSSTEKGHWKRKIPQNDLNSLDHLMVAFSAFKLGFKEQRRKHERR